ncbi:MAG: addiction module protein [Polaromonas sp.]
MNAVLKTLNHLSVEEKLQLVEDLWDDIAEQKAIPVSQATQTEVMKRAAWRDANPGHGKTLDQIILEAGVRL